MTISRRSLLLCLAAFAVAPSLAHAMANGLTAIPTTGLFIEMYQMVKDIFGGFLGLSAAGVAGIFGLWQIAVSGKFLQGCGFLGLAALVGFGPALLEKLYLLTWSALLV